MNASPKRYPPDDPREWLNRARSNLLLAESEKGDVYLEDLCFHAQQAAEKAVKALLIHREVEYPYAHDLAELLTLLQLAGLDLPESVRKASKLTRFAIVTRYPGTQGPVAQEEYEEAISAAEEVVQWVERQVGSEA